MTATADRTAVTLGAILAAAGALCFGIDRGCTYLARPDVPEVCRDEVFYGRGECPAGAEATVEPGGLLVEARTVCHCPRPAQEKGGE